MSVFLEGVDAGPHLHALQRVVAQVGQLQQGQYWHPYEVIELRSHAWETGNEREFAACTVDAR